MSICSEKDLDINPECIAPVYVVSGGKGIAGNSVVRSVLVQFPGNKVPLIMIPDVDSVQKVQNAVCRTKETDGVIVHTMVDPLMRELLVEVCESEKVKHFDLVGGLLDYLSLLLQREPVSKPGLDRLRNIEHLRRVAAIEFTMKHDDGLNSDQLSRADIVICGVSRTGKTPLSIYMGMFGWKVANVPLIPGIDPPLSLWKVDKRRVFGLITSPHYLIAQRKNRMAQLGLSDDDDYINPRKVREELEYSFRIFRKEDFAVFNITNKPIESTASEILTQLTESFGRNRWQQMSEV